GVSVKRDEQRITWNVEDARKGGYEYYMLKEIHEQPKVIRDTLRQYIAASAPAANLSVVGGAGLENMLILACGTSYNAALIGKYIIEQLVRVPVRVEIASEFNYYGQTSVNNRAIVLTQSGETADAIKGIRHLKDEGVDVTVITNVVGSTASRLADQVVYTLAGPEISVPATKSFMAQIIALYWLAIPYVSDMQTFDSLMAEMRRLPSAVQQILNTESLLEEVAANLSGFENIFLIGRGINYPVALEGALKIKEVAYIHAEGYAAGELKHGPFALLTEATPVIAFVSRDTTLETMMTNIKEIKARKAPVLAISEAGNEYLEDIADLIYYVPEVEPLISPVVNTVVCQLLAYYMAKERGCAIDFPRNLAKSVTVE
ncbi:MAG: isomerizing glutamine--fructose-6-phosphate transaminase, partial [Deltaproteobacteria bacterium]|nr:isomerizing glutamine--fructose-6-phosphate transaminase [Deltaproteobacteria bacterium]